MEFFVRIDNKFELLTNYTEKLLPRCLTELWIPLCSLIYLKQIQFNSNKHGATLIKMLRPTDCLSVLDYFVGLAVEGLIGHMAVLNWTLDLEMVYGGQFWILVAWWLIFEMHTLYVLKCTIQSQFDILYYTRGTLRTRSALVRLKCYRKMKGATIRQTRQLEKFSTKTAIQRYS